MAVQTIAEAAMVVRADFTKAGGDVRRGANTLARTISSITATVTGVGLAGMVGFGLKSAAALEQAQIGFETMLGSAQKAGTFLKGLQNFAAKTPFELPGLIDASRTLLGVGVAAKDVIPTLTAFGDAAGALGIQQDAFQRIMIAVGQSISAGKIKLGDMNQLMNNGLPIWKLMSEAMHKPVPELQAMITHGDLLTKDVLPALQRQMEKDYGGAMAKQSQTLAGVWSTLKDTVAIGLAGALQPLVPILADFLPKAAAAAGRGLAAMSAVISAVVTAVKTGTVSVGGFAGDMQSAALHIQSTIGPITTVVSWLWHYRDALASVVAVIYTYRTAVLVASAATKAWAAIQTVISFLQLAAGVRSFAAAWALLDVAMTANPIGLVVAALAALVVGIIYAWRHSETFRTVVIAAWNAIKVAVKAVADFFVNVVWPGLVAAWHGIQSAAAAVGRWFTGTLWPALKRVWDAWAAASMWLWHTILEPVWKGISWAVHTASAVIQLAIAVVVAYFKNVVAPFYMWLWHNVFQPVWRGISYVVQANIQVIRAVLNTAIAFFRNNVAPVLMWLWHNVVSPVMNGWRVATQAMWNFIRPILTALGNFIKGTLVNNFKSGVSAIKGAWDLLKKYALDPVRFVVNTVINPLIGGFNKVAKIFGTPTITPIPGFAEGGRIPGAPSSRDNRLAWLKNGAGQPISNIQVATGEFIVNARDTAKALPLLEWINGGMRGGPASATRRIGRRVTEMPGDGSEGWAFAGGGLVGFLSNVWDAVSDPSKLIKKPLEAMVARIPGGDYIKTVLTGMGHKLIDGFVKWVGGFGGGGGITGTGSIGKAQAFVKAQAGKPYVWNSAGPGGFDCSGIVSAVWNVLKGKNPYSHTFSTGSLPGPWFDTSKKLGALVAGWSHPGQRPASASVGHMAGMIGGLPFESTGSSGVRVGARARRTTEFANQGIARASGGLVELIKMGKVSKADFGAVTLAPGANMVYNHTGQAEPMETTRPGAFGQGGGRMHPDDIRAIAEALGGTLGRALLGTVPASRAAARQIGKRPR